MFQDAWTDIQQGRCLLCRGGGNGCDDTVFLHSSRGPSGRARVSARAVGERQARLSARAVSSVGHRRPLQVAGFKLEATEAEH